MYNKFLNIPNTTTRVTVGKYNELIPEDDVEDGEETFIQWNSTTEANSATRKAFLEALLKHFGLQQNPFRYFELSTRPLGHAEIREMDQRAKESLCIEVTTQGDFSAIAPGARTPAFDTTFLHREKSIYGIPQAAAYVFGQGKRNALQANIFHALESGICDQKPLTLSISHLIFRFMSDGVLSDEICYKPQDVESELDNQDRIFLYERTIRDYLIHNLHINYTDAKRLASSLIRMLATCDARGGFLLEPFKDPSMFLPDLENLPETEEEPVQVVVYCARDADEEGFSFAVRAKWAVDRFYHHENAVELGHVEWDTKDFLDETGEVHQDIRFRIALRKSPSEIWDVPKVSIDHMMMCYRISTPPLLRAYVLATTDLLSSDRVANVESDASAPVYFTGFYPQFLKIPPQAVQVWVEGDSLVFMERKKSWKTRIKNGFFSLTTESKRNELAWEALGQCLVDAFPLLKDNEQFRALIERHNHVELIRKAVPPLGYFDITKSIRAAKYLYYMEVASRGELDLIDLRHLRPEIDDSVMSTEVTCFDAPQFGVTIFGQESRSKMAAMMSKDLKDIYSNEYVLEKIIDWECLRGITFSFQNRLTPALMPRPAARLDATGLEQEWTCHRDSISRWLRSRNEKEPRYLANAIVRLIAQLMGSMCSVYLEDTDRYFFDLGRRADLNMNIQCRSVEAKGEKILDFEVDAIWKSNHFYHRNRSYELARNGKLTEKAVAVSKMHFMLNLSSLAIKCDYVAVAHQVFVPKTLKANVERKNKCFISSSYNSKCSLPCRVEVHASQGALVQLANRIKGTLSKRFVVDQRQSSMLTKDGKLAIPKWLSVFNISLLNKDFGDHTRNLDQDQRQDDPYIDQVGPAFERQVKELQESENLSYDQAARIVQRILSRSVGDSLLRIPKEAVVDLEKRSKEYKSWQANPERFELMRNDLANFLGKVCGFSDDDHLLEVYDKRGQLLQRKAALRNGGAWTEKGQSKREAEAWQLDEAIELAEEEVAKQEDAVKGKVRDAADRILGFICSEMFDIAKKVMLESSTQRVQDAAFVRLPFSAVDGAGWNLANFSVSFREVSREGWKMAYKRNLREKSDGHLTESLLKALRDSTADPRVRVSADAIWLAYTKRGGVPIEVRCQMQYYLAYKRSMNSDAKQLIVEAAADHLVFTQQLLSKSLSKEAQARSQGDLKAIKKSESLMILEVGS